MNSVRNKTHEELSEIFHDVAREKKFSHYFTNHKDFRMLVNEPKGKAIIQTILLDDRGDGYSITTYSALEDINMKLISEIGKSHNCECKMSILQSVMAQVN